MESKLETSAAGSLTESVGTNGAWVRVRVRVKVRVGVRVGVRESVGTDGASSSRSSSSIQLRVRVRVRVKVRVKCLELAQQQHLPVEVAEEGVRAQRCEVGLVGRRVGQHAEPLCWVLGEQPADEGACLGEG